MLKRATLILSLMLALTISSSGQARPTNLKPGSLEAKALAFFEQIEDRNFDEYLRRVRLPKVSAAFKAEVLSRIGIAVITLGRLAIDPANLVSGITTINNFNARVTTVDKLPYPSPDERFKFIRAIAELVKARNEAEPHIARH